MIDYHQFEHSPQAWKNFVGHYTTTSKEQDLDELIIFADELSDIIGDNETHDLFPLFLLTCMLIERIEKEIYGPSEKREIPAC